MLSKALPSDSLCVTLAEDDLTSFILQSMHDGRAHLMLQTITRQISRTSMAMPFEWLCLRLGTAHAALSFLHPFRLYSAKAAAACLEAVLQSNNPSSLSDRPECSDISRRLHSIA